MSSQMIIRMDEGLKEQVSQLARIEGKTLSELVRSVLLQYTRERDMSSYIDGLWERIGERLTENQVSEADVDEAIRQVRAKQ